MKQDGYNSKDIVNLRAAVFDAFCESVKKSVEVNEAINSRHVL